MLFDLAAAVQGHYGAMRNAGAEGSTYLHTQLMQVLLLPILGICIQAQNWPLEARGLLLHHRSPDPAGYGVSLGPIMAQVLPAARPHIIGSRLQAHAAAKARKPAATAPAVPFATAAGPDSLPHQKAEWASIVQHAAAASGIRSALQVQAQCTAWGLPVTHLHQHADLFM